MTQTRRPAPTPDAITAALGRRLAALRKAAGIRSQEELGKRMSKHGVDWSRVTVDRLENGKRGAITVQELLALAYVLGVPPVALIADPHHVRDVPITPEETVNAWDALGWITGAKPLGLIDPTPAWTNTNAEWMLFNLITLARAYGDLSRAPRVDMIRDDDGELVDDPAEVRVIVERNERRALESVANVLRRIETVGDTAALEVPEPVRRRAAELDVDLPVRTSAWRRAGGPGDAPAEAGEG